MTNPRWENDAVVVNGALGKTSMACVVDWLTDFHNYTRWKGDTVNGLTKEALLTELNAVLKANGIHYRTNADLRTKIADLHRRYKMVVDWKANTGEGILRADEVNGVATVNEYIKKKCPYFDELNSVMAERPSSRPLWTSESSVRGRQHANEAVRAMSEDDQSESGTEIESEEEMDAASDPSSVPASSPSPIVRTSQTPGAFTTLLSEGAQAEDISKRAIFSPPGQNKKKKTTKSAFAALTALVGNPSQAEERRAELELRRVQLDESRFGLEKTKLAMETALLEANLRLKNIEVAKQLALARRALLDAGYTQEEVDLELPKPSQI